MFNASTNVWKSVELRKLCNFQMIGCYILVKSVIYNDFIWFHLWPFVARSMWATLPITVKRIRLPQNSTTFWHQPPADVHAIAWTCCVACLVCGVLPNQDLLPVASTEEESEKDKNRHLAGQDPNWHLVAMSLWEKLSTVPTLSQRHIAKTF